MQPNRSLSSELDERSEDLFGTAAPEGPTSQRAGVLPHQAIEGLIARGAIKGAAIERAQLQPASLDLRIGKIGFRINASFLPGRNVTVQDKIEHLKSHPINLSAGSILEKGAVYVLQIEEELSLNDTIYAVANPKSSIGRLDVFTRLIADGSDAFDVVPPGFRGSLWAEVSPRTFSVRVKQGSRLNQIRFRRRTSSQHAHTTFHLSDRDLETVHAQSPIVDGAATIRGGLNMSVNLDGSANGRIVGFRANKYASFIDIDKVGDYDPTAYWHPLFGRDDRSVILEPGQFYILASKERLHIPADLAAEMVAFDPMMGEFRVHYAGFFDPGFGRSDSGAPGSRAVLEVRTYDIPFLLQDGQTIGRLVFERLAERPRRLYGDAIGSNYQGQGLKLSKHFRAWPANSPSELGDF